MKPIELMLMILLSPLLLILVIFFPYAFEEDTTDWEWP